MGSNFGRQLKISVFGQSHSEGIGVVADGFPAGFKIDRQRLSSFMQRRARDTHHLRPLEKRPMNFIFFPVSWEM